MYTTWSHLWHGMFYPWCASSWVFLTLVVQLVEVSMVVLNYLTDWVTLWWTSVPPLGSCNTPSYFILPKPAISTSRQGFTDLTFDAYSVVLNVPKVEWRSIDNTHWLRIRLICSSCNFVAVRSEAWMAMRKTRQVLSYCPYGGSRRGFKWWGIYYYYYFIWD